MNSLDALITRIRRFLEDITPWYDRAEEEAKERKTEAIRLRSIRVRIHAKQALDAYRRVHIGQ